MNEKKITEIISNLMLEKKALDIKIVKVDKLTTLTDYFVNCSSESDPQTRAIKNHIQDTLSSKHKIKPIHIEWRGGVSVLPRHRLRAILLLHEDESNE